MKQAIARIITGVLLFALVACSTSSPSTVVTNIPATSVQQVSSGTGIEPDDLPYVFDRFYRADKARGANSGKLGLGLAICKALVTAQGGVIAAESAGKDRGTAIVMIFAPAN